MLKNRAKILDVGSGSGRDACYFQKHGYQVTALEPSKNLCREIRKVFSGEIVCSDIQSYQPIERYDGIWACALLIHLQEKEVLCFFEKIDLYLNNNGIVYVSRKNGISTEDYPEGEFLYVVLTERKIEEATKFGFQYNNYFTNSTYGNGLLPLYMLPLSNNQIMVFLIRLHVRSFHQQMGLYNS